MELINEKLLKDEKVLWKRIKPKNLLNFIPFSLMISLIIFILLTILFLNILIRVNSPILFYFFLLVYILLIMLDNFLSYFVIIKTKRDIYKFFESNTHMIKNYLEIDLITNMRIIKKNYNFLKLKEKNISKLFLKSLIIEKDLLMIHLNSINKIIFQKDVMRIVLFFDDLKDDQLFYIDFWKFVHQKDNRNEMSKVRDLLIKIVPLVKYKENDFEIEYLRKNEV